ncbi:MAG TPA: MarR family transcriptional regulator [Dehalococcoidia bacterium]|jgi:hypothetical protein|nr:MarR family transcriptional regulator [Dehalococcoidia bacterium]
MSNYSTLTDAVVEVLRARAAEFGDDFQLKRESSDKLRVRCFRPQRHKNGDAHPSAVYHLGKYIYCPVCGFKESEKKLANRLGLGVIEGGLTLQTLAEAKRLPVDFLQKWGWRTQKGKDGKARVLIPWYDEQGVMKHAPAYHVRHYINKGDEEGPRFTWDLPRSSELRPYGVWRISEWIEEAKASSITSYICLTESELDCLTLWLHGIPANATGGADGWRSSWAGYFSAFQRVVILQEPGQAGLEMVKRIGKDLIRVNAARSQTGEDTGEILACPFPEDIKDASALHLSVNGDSTRFRSAMQRLIKRAVPAAEIIAKLESEEQEQGKREQEEERQRLLELARPLLDDPGVLHRAIHTVEDLGVVGERRNIGLLRLLVRSRALARPVNVEVNSPSSAGKTHTVTGTLALEDDKAYYELTASTERALIYLEEPLAHRILYIQEPEGLAQGVGFAAIKSLVWEGRLKYDTVVKEGDDFVGRHIEKEGPTGLIVTTTTGLEEQLSNRLLRLEVDASSEQTRRVLNVIARRVNGAKPNIDLAPWHAFSRLLGEPTDVEIPFSYYLAERISTSALRIRRDFTHLLTLIQASAVEHQYQRSKTQDGRIIATVADYAHVYSLVKDVFQAVQEEGITRADREMIAAVEYLTTPEDSKPGEKPVTQAAIRSHLGLSKSQVSYRVNRLIGLGYLANLEQRRGKPQQIVLGAPLPEEVPPLPSPCRVAEWLIEAGRDDLVIPWVDPVTGEVHDCAKHVPTYQAPTGTLTRTPEPCLRCLNSEVETQGSATDRTPEPSAVSTPRGSGVRLKSADDAESSTVKTPRPPSRTTTVAGCDNKDPCDGFLAEVDDGRADLEGQMVRGKRAIALAKDRGFDSSQWEAELGKLEAFAQAKEVAQHTKELLSSRGWCLWKCSVLDGDIIVVLRDELVTGYPEGYPVYTEAELEELCQGGVSEATIRLIHEAKKTAGATVESVENARGRATSGERRAGADLHEYRR